MKKSRTNSRIHIKMQKRVAFLKKREYKHAKDKNYRKVRDHCHYNGQYRIAACTICNLKYSVSKKNHIVFHNRSNYDYHFIIKELAGQFTSLEENTEKNINVSVPIDKNGKEITRIIS